MAGDEHGVIAHGPQAGLDAVNELVKVALRKIGTSDAAGKQHIADKGALELRRKKHHMAGCVTGAVAHLQGVRAQRDGVAVVQPAGGLERLGLRKTEHHALLGQAVDPELIARVRSDDGHIEPLRQLPGAAGVVDMGMGEPDLFELEAQPIDLCQQVVQIPARVDHGGLLGVLVPDQGAVLLKGRDGDGEVGEHGGAGEVS